MEWVCVHEWCTTHFPTQSQFIYLPPAGLRKSRDLPISSIDLITSGHLKIFTSFLQGLKSLSGNGTRDSCGHPEHSTAAQRGQCILLHNPGTAVAQPKQHGGFHQLKFMERALRCFLVVHPAVLRSMLHQWVSKTNHDLYRDFSGSSFLLDGTNQAVGYASLNYHLWKQFFLLNREEETLKQDQNLHFCFQIY